MSFRDLFATFPDKVMELCVEEAYQGERPYCAWWPDDDNVCALCDRHAFEDGEPYVTAKSICDVCTSEECRQLWLWYRGRSKHRQMFRRHYGKTIYQMPKAMRRDAIASLMLWVEAYEKEISNGTRKDRTKLLRAA